MTTREQLEREALAAVPADIYCELRDSMDETSDDELHQIINDNKEEQ